MNNMESHINNKIESIRNALTYSSCGRANNCLQFFETVIRPQFASKETIKDIHRALIEYVRQPKAVFPIRLYGSMPKDKYRQLRRGFLSEYPDGLKTFFCDNTFAMPFAAMKFKGVPYSASEISEHLNNRDVLCGFGSTSEERELAFYAATSKNRLNLNAYGWYLAHIIPVGYNYIGKETLSNVFPNPDRNEWESDTEHIRRVELPLTDYQRSILVAHFLRLLHPLNSFVIPKKNLVNYDGKNLGEEPELISIVQEYITREFPEEYSELKELMQIPEPSKVGDQIEEIVWSRSESEIKKLRKATVSKRTVAKSKNAQKKAPKKDIYDDDKEYSLSNTLKSIGKKAFIHIYGAIKKHGIDVSIEQVAAEFIPFNTYSQGSQQSRLSSTRSIINHKLEADALDIILHSENVDNETQELAKKYLTALENEY